MRYQKSFLFSALTAFLFLGASFTMDNGIEDKEKESILIRTMLDGFSNYHFSPHDLDDNFSQNMFELYLKRLDGRKRFLIQDDVNQLRLFAKELDDEIQQGSYKFFDLSVRAIDAGTERAEKYFKEIIASDFSFDTDESFEMDGDKREYAKGEETLKDRWRKILKYEVLNRYYNAMEAQKDELEKKPEDRKKDFEEKTKEQLLDKAVADTKDVFEKWFVRLNETKRTDRLEMYLNTVTNVHDPHSGYYAPIDKQNFDIGMSGKLEGIGARLQTNDEGTKVTEIITGGPAWEGGELEANDIITKVAQGEEEAVDVRGFNINDVVKLIRGKKGTEVRLTVTKSDGSEVIIPIIRDIVIIDEGYAKSLILDYQPNSKKGGVNNIGYLYLPRFYADFQDEDGRQCSEDVAQEIIKLKKQGVENIILDLRDNGGGSLRDVVKMSGLFIEEGPIVQVKSRDRSPKILSDTDERVLFDGNLIVMVNQFSASASEILAAAMQDYDRAVIIGSGSTFGKGTVQRFVDLDRMFRGKQEVGPLGSVKMTIQKFYRIDGGSTQLKGVEPDIVLPDEYKYIDLGEKEYDYAMDWTSIEPVRFEQKVNRVKNLDKLRSNSKKRVALNPTFKEIEDNAKRFKDVREDTDYNLNFDKYAAERKADEKEAEQYEDIMKDDIAGLSATNLEVDVAKIEADPGKKERNEKWIEGVKKDVYLQEALMIMKDMMK